MSESIWFRRYCAGLAVVDRTAMGIVTLAMAVLTVVLVLQVFFRYVLNASLDWGWDVPRVCFIWMVLMSIPLGVRNNVHVGIDLLIDLLGPRNRRVVTTFNALCMLMLSGVLAYYGAQLVRGTWDQAMPNIPLSVGMFYVALVFSQIHVALHLVRIIIVGHTEAVDWSKA